MSERIGFIGLGAMGLGMCRNLLAAGYRVSGYDVDPRAGEALGVAGGEPASSPAEAARGSDLLAVCVFNVEQAEAVLFGTDGAAAVLPPGTVVAMHTTMSPGQAKGLGARVAEAGLRLADAPITGGKVGADEGTLTVIASGPPDVLDACAGIFAAIGKRIYRTGGAIGDASTVKMINQLLVGVHVVATAEAMALAAKAGADLRTVYDVISHGGGNSAVFRSRVPQILDADYGARGVVDIFLKDLGIVSEAAAALDFPVPLAATALGQFRAAAAAGLGRTDDAAVVKVYEDRGRVSVSGRGRRT